MVVVYLMGKVADILRQPIDADVAAIEPHLLRDHPKRSVRYGLGAWLRPQRIAQFQKECFALLFLQLGFLAIVQLGYPRNLVNDGADLARRIEHRRVDRLPPMRLEPAIGNHEVVAHALHRVGRPRRQDTVQRNGERLGPKLARASRIIGKNIEQPATDKAPRRCQGSGEIRIVRCGDREIGRVCRNHHQRHRRCGEQGVVSLVAFLQRHLHAVGNSDVVAFDKYA